MLLFLAGFTAGHKSEAYQSYGYYPLHSPWRAPEIAHIGPHTGTGLYIARAEIEQPLYLSVSMSKGRDAIHPMYQF